MITIFKYFLISTICISAYGLLPVSFNFFIYSSKSNPNTLVIIKDTWDTNSCLYRNADIESGTLIIPTCFSKKYLSIDTGAINIIGKNPFELYDSMFNTQEIIVKGKVVALDTLSICDSSSFKFAPRFNIESWATNNYYPRYRIYNSIFQYIFWVSGIFSIITALFFIFWVLKGIRVKNRS